MRVFDGQKRGGQRHTAQAQLQPEAPPAALQPALDRPGTPAELLSRFVSRLALQRAENQRGAVFFRQSIQLLVECPLGVARRHFGQGLGFNPSCRPGVLVRGVY